MPEPTKSPRDSTVARLRAPDGSDVTDVVLAACSCATVPPTVPTCRSPHDHLPGCPSLPLMWALRAQWMAFCAVHGHLHFARSNGQRCVRCDLPRHATEPLEVSP